MLLLCYDSSPKWTHLYADSITTGWGRHMGAPSQHISLRINEEDLMLIDAKIGQLGANIE